MGLQPPSQPHTGASRRARRSPSANKTKGASCRLPPQLLSRSSYAWFWPSSHWKLRTHSAARSSAAPDTEMRFPCLQTRSGPRSTREYVQAQGNAQEIPRRAIFLTTVPVSSGDGDSSRASLAGDGDYRHPVCGRGVDPQEAARRDLQRDVLHPRKPLDLNKMTKQQLIEKVAAQTELKKSEAELAVDSVLAVIAEALQANERVDLRGFGSFVVKDRKERQGRNPRTGETITIAAKRDASFKPGKELTEKLAQVEAAPIPEEAPPTPEEAV